MNRLLVLTVSILLPISLSAQNRFFIKGKVPAGYSAKFAVLEYQDGEKYKSDTSKLVSGTFEFKGSISRPEMAQLSLIVPRSAVAIEQNNAPSADGEASLMKNRVLLYLDDNLQVIFDNAGKGVISGGGKEQKLWEAYIAENREKNKQGSGMFSFEKNVVDFIKKNPDSYVSVDVMQIFAGVIQPKVFEPMYESLSTRMKNTDKVKGWKKNLEIAKRFDVGQPSIDFTLNNTDGQAVSLSSFRGKYVLLDFWASWCGPCRATHPELIKIYNKNKDKNFQILAVSLDTKKDLWLKAIAEDNIPWLQVSDLKGASGEVTKMYNVTQIPQNLLIDPAGNIVGRNLIGEALDTKLNELLK
jgi:peroxiredoxin